MGAVQLVLLSQPGGEGTVGPLRGPKNLPQSRTPAGFITQDLHLFCATVHDQALLSVVGSSLCLYHTSHPFFSAHACIISLELQLIFILDSYTSSVDSNTHLKGVYLPKTPT